MITLALALVLAQPISVGNRFVIGSNSTLQVGSITGKSGDRLFEFRGSDGKVVAWIDDVGGYHRASEGPPRPVFVQSRPDDFAEIDFVRRIVAAMPAPQQADHRALVGGLVTLWVAMVLMLAVGGTLGWRRVTALLLARPLRRLSKWLERGSRGRDATALRFGRDLRRTIEQLESERRS